MSLLITRPRPMPLVFIFLRSFLIDPNSLNSFSLSFYFIPMPLSVTEILIYFGSFSTLMRIFPFLSLNLTAFDIKFKKTCYILLISVVILNFLSNPVNTFVILMSLSWILSSYMSIISSIASLMSKYFGFFMKFF